MRESIGLPATPALPHPDLAPAVPPSTDDSALNKDALINRDIAELLYKQSIGGLAVSFAASSFLAYMTVGKTNPHHVLLWWLAMVIGLALRSLDTAHSRLRHLALSWNGQSEILRFSCGVLLTALIWISFPLLFFSSLDLIGRTATSIILSAMAGGSATVLAPSLRLSMAYCASMLVPASLMFFRGGGSEYETLGTLGLIFFVIMVVSCRVSHASALSAIRLNRTNEHLLVEVEGERNLTQQANADLKVAQFALRQTNLSLESRIKERTLDLELEIAEREKYSRQLARLASTDPLTGLYNRARLADQLTYTLAEAVQSAKTVAVLFIDLDKFKEVNDVKGHLAGDRVLQAVANRLSACIDETADLARWGGDEFVIVLREITSLAHAVQIAESLRTQLVRPIETDKETVLIDATIGISLFPDHGSLPDELIRAADVAMYAGKEENRGKVLTFEPSLAQNLVERHQLEQALREAIATDALSLVFQPIINARTGACEALEALLRWTHPTRGPISPACFIPIAERSGQIVAIGRWVLREACRAAASWAGPHAPAVSINVSAAQILSGDLATEVFVELLDSGLSPHRLHIELTESLFLADRNEVVSTLNRLRSKGIRISLDDFGTGFSSLAYLQHLPIDFLKIDQSFVREMDTEAGQHPVVTAIVSISRALKLSIIAEGVEEKAQADRLRAMGVDFFQGYYFSRPLPQSQVVAWLAPQTPDLALTR